jgi:hypothetical protein
MQLYPKDSDAHLDFKFDLAPLTNGQTGADSDWLESGETIASFTVTADTGIDLHDGSTTFDGEIKDAPGLSDSNTSVTYWLAGGTPGDKYKILLEFETSAGRIDQKSMIIKVRNN